MAGAGPTMLLREENGCCSRRQSSSSAGVSTGSGSGIEGQSSSKMEGVGELQLPAASGRCVSAPAGCRELWFRGRAV